MKTAREFVVVQGQSCGKTQSIFMVNTLGVPKGNPDWCKILNAGSDTEPAEITIHGFIGSNPFAETANDCKRIADELKAIPKGRKINVDLHSQGGNVWEGLGIYDLLRERREDVTVRIRGLAASAGSFICMAAGKVVMPAAARWMHHDAMTFAQGNAAELSEVVQMLERESENIAAIYAEKSGRPKAEIRAEMKKTTWMTGAEAKAAGFVDEVVNTVPLNCADLDLSILPGQLPEDLRNQVPAGSGGSTPPPKPTQPAPIMNRQQLEAWLTKRGVAFNATATDAELVALVENYDPKPVKAPVEPNKPTAVGDSNVVFADDMKAIKAQLAEERRGRVMAEVQACADEARIPGNSVDEWVNDILAAPTAEAGQKLLNRLKSMPQRPPGVEPVDIVVTDEDPKSVVKALTDLRAPVASMLKGNNVAPNTIREHSIQVANVVGKHLNRLLTILNANTIDSDLKRTIILSQVMRDFKRRILPIGAFSTVFGSVPLDGTDKVAVPYYPLFTTASTDFNQNNGYVFGNSTTTNSRDVTVNKRKYQPFNFNSSELRRQPYLNVQQLAALCAEQLGIDVFNDILSLVTAANFGAAVKTEPAGAFDSDDVIDIATIADQCDWPEMGRTLILDSRYKGNLLKDPDIKNADKSASAEALRNGSIGRIAGFDIVPCPRIPTNAENLIGMAVFKSAILVATAPIMPAPGVRKQLVSYDLVTDPETGLSFEYRYWGNPDKDEDREVIECNYGSDVGQGAATFAVDGNGNVTDGNKNALMRLTSQ